MTADWQRLVQYVQYVVCVKECMSIDLRSHPFLWSLLGLHLCFQALCHVAIYFFISSVMCLLLVILAFSQSPS